MIVAVLAASVCGFAGLGLRLEGAEGVAARRGAGRCSLRVPSGASLSTPEGERSEPAGDAPCPSRVACFSASQEDQVRL